MSADFREDIDRDVEQSAEVTISDALSFLCDSPPVLMCRSSVQAILCSNIRTLLREIEGVKPEEGNGKHLLHRLHVSASAPCPLSWCVAKETCTGFAF